MVGIYKITNLINGKVYIGQSINIEKRIKEHFYKAKCFGETSYNSALHQAIRKYGEENFSWEILEECSIDKIDDKERFYIEQYNSITPDGYNILDGGQKYRAKPKYCMCCGKQISKDAVTGLCFQCHSKTIRVVEWPSREELKQLIRTTPFTIIGDRFNVADNTVRKWCDRYNLPRRVKDIKSYSDEEWELI